MPRIKTDKDYVGAIIRIPMKFYLKLKKENQEREMQGNPRLLHDDILDLIKKGYGKK